MTIELKIGKFTPKHIGQINFYLEALNDNAALGIHMFFGEAEISDSGNNAAGTTAADSVKNG